MSGVWAEMSQKGVVDVTVQRKFYPQIAQHWESQLTGRHAAKWGRIWIDPSSVEKDNAEERICGRRVPAREGCHKRTGTNVLVPCLSARHKSSPMSRSAARHRIRLSAETCSGRSGRNSGRRWVGGKFGSSVFKCKTSRIGPSGPWPCGGCARSSSRSLATPDSSPGSIGPTDSSLTSVHRYAW